MRDRKTGLSDRQMSQVDATAVAPGYLPMVGCLLLGGLLFAGAGCTDALVDSYRYGTVEVMAVTTDGAPVEGVAMVLHRGGQHLAYGSTDASGIHGFSYVPFGFLGILATIPRPFGTQDFASSIVVEQLEMVPGGHQSLVFTLIRCQSMIHVETLDDAGSPVANVGVDLYDSAGVIEHQSTDGEGRAVFDEVPCGQVGVVLDAPTGYRLEPGYGGTYVDALQATADAVFNLVFRLERE